MKEFRDEIRVYSSESVVRRPGVLLKGLFRDLFRSHALAWRLSVRDIRGMYRQSILGIVWAFILPLGNTVTWLFLRKSGIVSMDETPIPYPVYVFAGAMLWSVLTESLTGPLQKVQAAKSMLTKINFPREAILLSSIYQTCFNTGIKVVLMFGGMLVLGYYPQSWTVAFFPFGLLALILTGTALGVVVTPLGILYNDIGRGLSLAMQFLMYTTPVVFPIPTSGWIATFVSKNPLTPLIMTARDWITGNAATFFVGFVWESVIMLFIFLGGLLIYRIAVPFLIERMSS